MKHQLARLAMIALLGGAYGCTEEQHTVREAVTFQAYGLPWVHRQSEISSSNRFLAPLHAGGNGYREEHSLEVADPKTAGGRKPIFINSAIYALQKNGHYKKTSCCEYYREQAELYNIDGKLVLEFSNARQSITDCFIYPAGRPDNERRPKAEQVFGTKVYGEFNPERGVFLVRTFDASQFSSADYKAQRADRSIKSHAEFMYRHRKPFNCA